MTQISCGDWLLDVDAEATRQAYASIAKGDPETCACLSCRNFAAARSVAYPPAALDLYARLGVRPDREAETCWFGLVEGTSGHLYQGWHHFIGRIVATSEKVCELAPGFEIWFRVGRSCAEPPFQASPDVVQAEFTTLVPWVITEAPEGTP